MKHTKGPWKFDSLKHLPEDYYLEDLCVAADGSIIAASISAPDHRSGAEACANARLIASAPELLEALTVIIGVYDAMGAPRGPARIVAEMTIAKATGGPS